jgi:hypothetical protein
LEVFMKHRVSVGAAVAAALLCGVALAGDLKSGPQVGKGCPPFHPMNVHNADNQSANGTKQCLV